MNKSQIKLWNQLQARHIKKMNTVQKPQYSKVIIKTSIVSIHWRHTICQEKKKQPDSRFQNPFDNNWYTQYTDFLNCNFIGLTLLKSQR